MIGDRFGMGKKKIFYVYLCQKVATREGPGASLCASLFVEGSHWADLYASKASGAVVLGERLSVEGADPGFESSSGEVQDAAVFDFIA